MVDLNKGTNYLAIFKTYNSIKITELIYNSVCFKPLICCDENCNTVQTQTKEIVSEGVLPWQWQIKAK